MEGNESRPIYAMRIPRWADRLDINGPCHVGRHYLTLIEFHMDWSGKTEFTNSLSPLVLRDNPTKPLSAAEHLRRFSDSQTNSSPYGKHDAGYMVTLRDELRRQAERILTKFQEKRTFTPDEEYKALYAWTVFLYTNIEPTQKGWEVAEKLREMFTGLPDEVRFAWLNAYCQTMAEYVLWAKSRIEFLNSCPRHWMSLPPITDDVRNIITPNEEWVKVLREVHA